MNEIRKALDDAYEWGKREANTPYPCSDDIRTEYEGWRDGLRLPPSEGETREISWELINAIIDETIAYEGPPLEAAINMILLAHGFVAHKEENMSHNEPAPSAEKALRERCEALAKRWDSESGRESFAPVFAEELLEALASSPAPSECQSCTDQGIDCADDCMRPAPEVKHPRIHVTDKRRGAVVVDASRPAPEAPK